MSSFEKILFVGGSADGTRRNVLANALTTVVLKPTRRLALSWTSSYPAANDAVEKAFYHREGIRTSTGVYEFFVVDGMTPLEAVTRVFEHYGRDADRT